MAINHSALPWLLRRLCTGDLTHSRAVTAAGFLTSQQCPGAPVQTIRALPQRGLSDISLSSIERPWCEDLALTAKWERLNSSRWMICFLQLTSCNQCNSVSQLTGLEHSTQQCEILLQQTQCFSLEFATTQFPNIRGITQRMHISAHLQCSILAYSHLLFPKTIKTRNLLPSETVLASNLRVRHVRQTIFAGLWSVTCAR